VSVGPENTFRGSVHKYLRSDLYHMKNNNQFVGGVPDDWYSGGEDLWIEYKFIIVPKRDETVIDLVSGKKPEISYLQQEWLESRHDEGRRVGVIVGCKAGGVWFPGISWKQTLTASKFRAAIMPRPDVAQLIEDLTA
jgi:hypothetical protein